MNNYVNFLKMTFENYQNSHTSWRDEVRKANDCVSNQDENYRFRHENAPWFYSGDFIDEVTLQVKQTRKLVFIAMNPKYSEWQTPAVYKDFTNFVQVQNGLFQTYDTPHALSYDRYEKFVSKLVNDDLALNRYKMLNERAIVIDWFPFYSNKFSVSLKNVEYPLYLLKNILGAVNEIQDAKIFAVGKAIRNVIRTFSEDSKSGINLLSKSDNIDMYSFKNQKIYTFSLASKTDVHLSIIVDFVKQNP